MTSVSGRIFSGRSSVRFGLCTSISLVALVGMSCGKKSSSSGTEAGGGAGGSKAKITDAENSIVTAASADLQLTSSLVLLPSKSATGASLASSADGKLRLRVESDAFEGVAQINNILCFFSQTKFWEQVGKGEYKALVDENLCEQKGGGGGDGGGGGGGESSGGSSYMTAFVKGTREKDKPLIGEIRFVSSDEGEKGAEYHARIVVAAPPSEQYPAGIFTMHYTPRVEGKVLGGGQIKARASEDGKKYILEHVEIQNGDDRKSNSYTVAELERSGNDFIGRVISAEKGEDRQGDQSWKRDSAFKVRFNKDYVNTVGNKVEEGGGFKNESNLKGCYDRNQYKTNIYRYDLLEANGKVKTLNSGFSIEAQSQGKTFQGNAGYYGIWLPEDANLMNGDTVNKVDWSGGRTPKKTPLTVVKAPGKLIKYSKETITLGALKGVDLNMHSGQDNYIARWDGNKLSIVAKVIRKDREPSTEEAMSKDVESENGWPINLWITSLNANINIPASELSSLSDAYAISFHKQEAVSGSASSLGNLVCFSNCPVMNPQASDFQQGNNGGGGFGQTSNLYTKTTAQFGGGQTNQASNVATPLASFTWNAGTRVIEKDSIGFSLPAGLSSNSKDGGGGGGVFSGPLIPEAAWQSISDKQNMDSFRLENSLDVFYRWQAGADSWSQYTALLDSDGNLVQFDQPLELSYVHTAANDFDGNQDANIIGKTFRLNYGGPGQLWGVPWKYNADVGREMPLFSLKVGTKLGSYTVRPMEGEQRMEKTADAKCASLDLKSFPQVPKLDKKAIDNTKLGNDNSPLFYIGGVPPSAK